MLNPGETSGKAVQRGVREEAGVNTELLDSLDWTEYWYGATQQGRCVTINVCIFI